MTPEALFQVVNFVALAGWIVLGLSVILRRDAWRDSIAGRAIPLALSAFYMALIVFFFWRAEGGFGSLEELQRLFAYPWAVLAGWVHYLAFDLFIGAWIARQTALEQLPRWPLALILPLTFMLGPIGLLAFFVARQLLRGSVPVTS